MRQTAADVQVRILARLDAEQRAGGDGISAEAIANVVGLSRATVGAHLCELQRRGMVESVRLDGESAKKWRRVERRKGRSKA